MSMTDEKRNPLKHRIRSAAALAGALVGTFALLAKSASGGPPVPALPVHGQFDGTLQRTRVATDPPTWNILVTGRLQLAGFGVGTAELRYDGVRLAPGGNNLAGDDEGIGVFTLRNGDPAFGTIRGLTSPTRDPDVLAIVGTLKVTHGTGILSNVTGTGIAVGEGRVSTGAVTFSLHGDLEGVAH
jgi:hypothetical protein